MMNEATGRIDAPEQTGEAPDETEVSQFASDRPVVLIVDDIPENLLAFEETLERDDIDMVTATSGEEALEILLETDVAVAILDVQMPEMDGYELASLMRGVEKTSRIPIIFVTASWQDQAGVFRGYEAGAVDYLFKPVDDQVLRSKVDVFVALEKHRQELREANRMREMFLAVLGHDLRSPLSSVLLSAEILSHRLERDEPLVERISRSGKRMARMIEQLLDVTRFRQDGSVALDPESTDLEALAEQILAEFHDDDRRRCELEVVGDTTGTWDTDRLLQVLANLVGNAAKHSPSDSPILIHIDGHDHHALSLRVQNEGPPIPEHLHGSLFEPFHGSDHRDGLGLGLFITRRLVEAHGGDISFTTRHETGTRFTVTLPRHGAV